MGSNKTSSFLSSSAPTNSNFDSIWQRREPRKHLLSTSSLVEGTDLISPQRSFDEGFNSEDDSEHYEDCSSGKLHLNISLKKLVLYDYNL